MSAALVPRSETVLLSMTPGQQAAGHLPYMYVSVARAVAQVAREVAPLRIPPAYLAVEEEAVTASAGYCLGSEHFRR